MKYHSGRIPEGVFIGLAGIKFKGSEKRYGRKKITYLATQIKLVILNISINV